MPLAPSRHPPQRLQQHPHPRQQVDGVAGRDHPPDHEAGVRGGDPTRTGSNVLVPSEQDLARRKPQVALRRVTRQPPNRSAGSIGRCSGRSRRTLSRNQLIDPVHPTRSASTVAGTSGVFASNCRTAGSNAGERRRHRCPLVRRRPTRGTARATVARPTPKSRATRHCGTPSATSRRIRAQSSTEITHPICLGGLV